MNLLESFQGDKIFLAYTKEKHCIAFCMFHNGFGPLFEQKHFYTK